MFVCFNSAARSSSAEATLRADQQRQRLRSRRAGHGQRKHGGRRRPRSGQRRDRILDLGRLVAEHQQAVRLADGEHAGKRQRCADLGDRQHAALLGGFHRIGSHPLEVDAADLGVLGRDWLQTRHAELDRLLHHIVQPLVLERSEQVMQVGRLGLRPSPLADGQHGPLAARQQRRPPFALAAVEHQHAVAGLEPEHVAEIMRLGRVERELSAGFERALNVQTGTAKVVTGHRKGLLAGSERLYAFRPAGARAPTMRRHAALSPELRA